VTASRQLYITPFQSDLLDLSRWLAALLVVLEHARSLIFLPYGTGLQPGLLGKIFYFITGFGHSAVMVFFVMSGFLVGGKVLEKLSYGNYNWRKYTIDRVSRLYAVYVLALLLGGALDYTGYHYMNRFGLYDRSFSGTVAVVNHNFHTCLTPAIFGLNLAMCQTILGPVFGSNGPLWSLANEFWYYLAGPLVFAMFFISSRWRLIPLIAALVLLVWFLPASILIYFLVWLLGAALYFVNRRAFLPLWISLILFAVSFGAARLQLVKIPYVADFLIGISFALVINSAAGASRRLLAHGLSRKMADFSYSVYLCHFPFLVFALSALYEVMGIGLRGSRTPLSFGIFFSVVILAYVWAFLVSLATERQTPRIRQFLHRLLGQEKSRQRAAEHRPTDLPPKVETPMVNGQGLPTAEQ
jgi:peptidoglycan/LPS O-acetylase OafA/YrhL